MVDYVGRKTDRVELLRMACVLADMSSDSMSDAAMAHNEGDVEISDLLCEQADAFAAAANALGAQLSYTPESHPAVHAVIWALHMPDDEVLEGVLDEVEPF